MKSFLLLSVWLVVCFASAWTNAEREKRSVPSTCTAEYAAVRPTHTMCKPYAPNSYNIQLTQQDIDEIVDYHNQLRASVSPAAADMQKMVWDETLARTAAKGARDCNNIHDEVRNEPIYPGIVSGQNIARSHPGLKLTFKDDIKRWFDEVEEYNRNNREYEHGTGHYLQVVYSRANRVGCGEAFCEDTPFLKVQRRCNYANGVDYNNTYEVGQPCSECPGHCDSSGQLCDCGGRLCFHGGELDVKTCTCKCYFPWEGDSCNELACPIADPLECKWREAEDCNKQFHENNCPYLCQLCGPNATPIPTAAPRDDVPFTTPKPKNVCKDNWGFCIWNSPNLCLYNEAFASNCKKFCAEIREDADCLPALRNTST